MTSIPDPPAGESAVYVGPASYDSLGPALDKIVESLDLASWHDGLRGKKVFVKPNMLGLFAPERQVTTNPALVTELVRLLRRAGAEVTVGDNCGVGGYGINGKVGKLTGIAEASEGAYENVARDTIQVDLKSRYLQTLVVSRAMLEADVLISVPKMKTHSLTMATGAVKNMFGLVSGMGKGRAHGAAPGLKDFASMLADICAIRPPDLTIMDAVVAMEGAGPSGGDPVEVGHLMASTDPVALDSIMCQVMGIQAEQVLHLAPAQRRGLGTADPEAIRVIGKIPSGRPFKMPATAQRYSMIGRFVNQRFFRPLAKSKLVLDKKICKSCGICAKGCPTGACQMDGDFPAIDHDACIRCFCCHELCPEGAWELKSFLNTIFSLRRPG